MMLMWYLQCANTTFAYTRADSLRGGNGVGRSWWDVRHYDLNIRFNLEKKSIAGSSKIDFALIQTPHDSMQIDLQKPMEMDSVVFDGKHLAMSREGNVYWVKYKFSALSNKINYSVIAYYHGSPRKAVNPPWDGGFSWTKDSSGTAWIAVSCQGLGASVWFPCKDAQWVEPDLGVTAAYTFPKQLTAVGNGRLTGDVTNGDERTMKWTVINPINSYDITFYIGDYVHWSDTLQGEKGKLDLNFWVLRQNEQRARKQFEVVRPMLHCYEYWMGPYPFYEDGYKLVDAPYLGMEHQSAVAYGNKYMMGYLGFDRTFTGIGMKFDYIIIHESGHEWFGNSITAKDMADNWVHEGITTYCESLFAECQQGRDAGMKYCRGEWLNTENDKPIIGDYGVNKEGSNDMYDKGAAIMYMIRKMTNDDEKFRQMLRGLSKDFYHKMVTTGEIENYIASHTGLELKAFFNEYLRTDSIPQLEYYIKDGKLFYKFNNVVDGFTLPLTVDDKGEQRTIKPTADWQNMNWSGGYTLLLTKDFLFRVKQ